MDDDDIYDAVEADMELQARFSGLSDDMDNDTDSDMVESCTNCGAYHSRPTFRCAACEDMS